MSEDSLGDSNAQNTSQDESEIQEQDKGESQETLISGNLIENVDRSTPNPINVEVVLNQLLQRQESFLSSFTHRQQQVEESLDRFIEYQTDSNEQFRKQVQRNDHFENKLDELRSHLMKNQTVGGDEDPAIIYNTASDREAGDIAAAHSLVRLRDPGGFRHDRSSVDLNPRLYLGTLPDESSRQCARSVGGATHASHGTRSGVQDKIGRVQDNTSRVFDHESKVLEEARRSLEEERKIFEEQKRILEEEKKQMFQGTGARPKEFVYRRNEQEVEGAFGLNYLHLNRWDDPSDEEVTFRNAPIRRHDRLESKITSKPRSLDQTNVRSCSNLEFSVAGDNPNGMDPREQPRHRPVFALEGRAADPSHFTTDDSGWATTLASKFSFPTRNEDLSTKIASSQFTLKHDESAGLHLSQSSDAYLPNTLHSFELNRKKSDNTSVIYSTSSMFARVSQQSQPCLSSVVHERVKEPIAVMSASGNSVISSTINPEIAEMNRLPWNANEFLHAEHWLYPRRLAETIS